MRYDIRPFPYSLIATLLNINLRHTFMTISNNTLVLFTLTNVHVVAYILLTCAFVI